jgi:hypothetical protein
MWFFKISGHLWAGQAIQKLLKKNLNKKNNAVFNKSISKVVFLKPRLPHFYE